MNVSYLIIHTCIECGQKYEGESSCLFCGAKDSHKYLHIHETQETSCGTSRCASDCPLQFTDYAHRTNHCPRKGKHLTESNITLNLRPDHFKDPLMDEETEDKFRILKGAGYITADAKINLEVILWGKNNKDYYPIAKLLTHNTMIYCYHYTDPVKLLVHFLYDQTFPPNYDFWKELNVCKR